MPDSSAWLRDDELAAIPACEESDPRALATQPRVSVLVLAYNHEAYLEQAVESVLAQECAFGFEILIGEDASTDGTARLCRALRARRPDRVRLITAPENVGMHRNFARLWARARGQYVALCEGDDYWTDRGKLAKQAAFLDAHPGFSMCGAETVRRDSEGREEGRVAPRERREAYSVEDLIPDYGFHTSSVLIRREGLRFPRWLWEVYGVDRPLYLLCAERGPVGFLPDCMSVYRLHAGGAWAPVAFLDKGRKGVALFRAVDRHFNFRHHRLIRASLARMLWSYAGESLLRGDRSAGRKLAALALSHAFPALPDRPGRVVRVLLRLAQPGGRRAGNGGAPC